MAPRTSPWPRIDAWLAENAPKVLAKLRRPIGDAVLARVEKALGRKLHPSLIEAYRAHDGADGEFSTVFGAVRAPREAAWARFMWWLPAEEAVARLSFMKDLGDDWDDAHFPIAEDAGGNLLLVDLDGGQVMAWDHEDWSTKKLADDFTAWMTSLADDMEARLVVTDEEDDEDDALRLLDKPATAPAAPDVGPDRAARVLIEVLLERKLLALAERFEIDPLVAELTDALETKDLNRRKKKVIATLEESEVIDEIFADDETLEALIEELG